MHVAAGVVRSTQPGLRELLVTLGRPPGLGSQIGLVGTFVAVTLAAALAAEMALRTVPLPFAVSHLGLWLWWLAWHSGVFPRARRRALRERRESAYRAVFGTQIVPGVCCGVSLMGGAALHGLASGSGLAAPATMALAVLLVATGSGLVAAGFAAIGFASAGFLYEYVESSEPIVARGVYRYIRHPLFLGGVIASVGAALVFSNRAALAGAAVNLLVLPAYKRLEDRRLQGVFGEGYASYTRDVAAFIPAMLWQRLTPRCPAVER